MSNLTFESPTSVIKKLKKQRRDIQLKMQEAAYKAEQPFWRQIESIDESIVELERERKLLRTLK